MPPGCDRFTQRRVRLAGEEGVTTPWKFDPMVSMETARRNVRAGPRGLTTSRPHEFQGKIITPGANNTRME